MHTYTLAIFLILLLSSCLEFPNPISVDARKLISSNGVFKVDLIHRHSPLSPYYNTSMTPHELLRKYPLGSISRGHNIHLSTAYYNANGIEAKLIDLIPDEGGDYLMKIALGTPQVEFIANADTGSDLIWIQCSPCKKCIPQKSPLFDQTKSSTFHTIPCNSSACTYPDLRTGCLVTGNSHNNLKNDSSACGYVAGYGDGTASVGLLATESITLPSSDATSLSLPSTVFGCGLQQQGSLGVQGEGIIGLGTGPLSLISQLGPKINHKFSYCLAPLTSKVASKLTFGADVTGPGVVSTPFTFVEQGSGSNYYHLTLDGISVGDKQNSVQVPSGLDIIIDSGTTLTFLPASVYNSLRTALASAITLSPVPSPQKPYDLCYNSGEQFSPPDVVFHFKGADVVLKAINTFRDIRDGVTCLAIMAIDDGPIFGNIAQVNFHVGYDLQAKQVSFAPTDCTHTA